MENIKEKLIFGAPQAMPKAFVFKGFRFFYFLLKDNEN